ncbi:MAG: nucleotidyltransferase domain-containing protein [Bacillota bacterium]
MGFAVTQFDTSLWRAAIAKKNLKREAYRRRKLAQLRRQLADYFARKKVARVYVIGSIVRPGAFDETSDIDIAVLGLKEDYLRVSSELEALVERELDLIELEYCRFAAEVEREGLRII